MSRALITASLVATMTMAGCRSESSPPPPIAARTGSVEQPPASAAPTTRAVSSADEVVARVNGAEITLGQLQRPLIEAYGLNILLNLVQLELAKQTAERAGVQVSPADVEAERLLTLRRMFKETPEEDYPQALEQFLRQERISEPEFAVVLETNAYLRKTVEPTLKDRINEAALREAFGAMYGETVQVRHIQVSNLQEVAEAKRRLAAGETFEEVARSMSRNAQTAPLGGEIPRFSKMTPGLPEAFRTTAFALKEGEVSDPVQAEGAYHVIKLEKRFEPKAVKFEDHREVVRQELEDRYVQAAVKDLRQRLGQQALTSLQIQEPTLQAQFQERLDKRDAQIKDREEVRKELARERERLATQPALPEIPTTAPTVEIPDAATAPAAPAPTTRPVTVPAPAAKPATPAPKAPTAPTTRAAEPAESPVLTPAATAPAAATRPR